MEKLGTSTFPSFQRVCWRPRTETEGILVPLKDETIEQLVKKFFGTSVTDVWLVGALYCFAKNLGMQYTKSELADQHMCTTTIQLLPNSNGANRLCHAASFCISTISRSTATLLAHPAVIPNQPRRADNATGPLAFTPGPAPTGSRTGGTRTRGNQQRSRNYLALMQQRPAWPTPDCWGPIPAL